MNFTEARDAPFWISLGGKSTIYCSGGIVLLWVTGILCFGILIAYFLISRDWKRRIAKSKSQHGAKALNDLRVIFVLCGITGYGSRILLILYPAWLAYETLLVVLNFYSWRYVSRMGQLDIVYRDLEKAAILDQVAIVIKDSVDSARDDPLAVLNSIKSKMSVILGEK